MSLKRICLLIIILIILILVCLNYITFIEKFNVNKISVIKL